MNLPARWHLAWRGLNLPEPEPQVFDNLRDRYTEPHRAYHTLQHLSECFAWFDQVSTQTKASANSAAIAIALWFHDAIYDPHRADNEAQSADWAAQVISDVGGGSLLQEAVHAMILATQHNAVPTREAMGLVVDIDLAIFGAPPGRFAQYEAQIRQEYAWVPETLFRQKRAEVIQAFLARPAIFTLEFFQVRLEQPARHNLHRSLATLRKGLS